MKFRKLWTGLFAVVYGMLGIGLMQLANPAHWKVERTELVDV